MCIHGTKNHSKPAYSDHNLSSPQDQLPGTTWVWRTSLPVSSWITSWRCLSWSTSQWTFWWTWPTMTCRALGSQLLGIDIRSSRRWRSWHRLEGQVYIFLYILLYMTVTHQHLPLRLCQFNNRHAKNKGEIRTWMCHVYICRLGLFLTIKSSKKQK